MNLNPLRLYERLINLYYKLTNASEPVIYCNDCLHPIPGDKIVHNFFVGELYDPKCFEGTEFEKEQEEMRKKGVHFTEYINRKQAKKILPHIRPLRPTIEEVIEELAAARA